jgi:arsenate reductase-like glutaredoxin family protein
MKNKQLINYLHRLADSQERAANTKTTEWEQDNLRTLARQHRSKAQLMERNPAQYPPDAAVVNKG